MSLIHKIKINWLGLDNAGKTTIIKRITMGDFFGYTRPTVGLDVQEYILGNTRYITWDLSGQRGLRERLWSSYLRGCRGIVWVVDSADPDRFPEVREELWKYVFKNPDIKNVPLLIFGNKQDLKEAVQVKKIYSQLQLERMERNSNFILLPTSAKTGKNLEKGLDWLRDQI